MGKIGKVELKDSQSIQIQHYEFECTVDGITEMFSLTASSLATSNEALSDGIDTIVVNQKNSEKPPIIIYKNEFYTFVDSNKDGKFDENDYHWKVAELVKEHFKNRMDMEDEVINDVLKHYSENRTKDISFRENLIKDLYLINKTNSFDMKETFDKTISESNQLLKLLYRKNKEIK
jgi:hypothetical protein